MTWMVKERIEHSRMRVMAIAAFACLLSACGGDGGAELAAGNSQLTPAQVDAALGPAEQGSVEDAVARDPALNGLDTSGNEAVMSDNADAADDGDEQ